MKKVLLSSVAALAVFAAAAPAVSAYTRNDPGIKYGPDNQNGKVLDKDGNVVDTTDPKQYSHTDNTSKNDKYTPGTAATNPYDAPNVPGNTSRPVTVEANVTYVRVTVKDVQGNPVAGVVVDIFDGENYHTGTTDANGDFAVRAKAGLVAKARVANAPAGYFVPGYLSAPKSATVAPGQMFTNIELTVEKTDTYNIPGQKTVTPGSDNGSSVDAKDAKSEAQKTEKAAKAAKDGKAASAQAGKALPKTSAAK